MKYIISGLAAFLIAGAAAAQNIPNTATSAAGSISSTITVPPGAAADSGYNRVVTYVPMVPYTDATTIHVAPADQVSKSTVYNDGFNRPFQRIVSHYSVVGSDSKDLVTLSDNRPQPDHYGFLPYTVEHPSLDYTFVDDAFQGQKDYYQALYPDEGYTSYSGTKSFSTALSRSTRTYAPGKANVGMGRSTSQSIITNGTESVRSWEVVDGEPVSTGWYAANRLSGTLVVGMADPSSSSSPKPSASVYKDKDGRVVMKQVKESESFDGSESTYLVTYYVYDEMGRLCFILPPKAVKAIEDNGWEVAPAVLDGLCFQYQYDDLGRLIAEKKPGEDAFTEYVYDKRERVVMTRNPLLTTDNKWQVSFMDANGRTIATSLHESGKSRQWWQDKIDAQTPTGNTDITWYFGTQPGEGIAPGETTIADNEMMSYSQYDSYQGSDPTGLVSSGITGTLSFSVNLEPGGETPVISRRVSGLPVYSRVRILNDLTDPASTGDWTASHIYYDDKGRTIYSTTYDYLSASSSSLLHNQLVANQYDFAGRLLVSKHMLKNGNDAANPQGFHTELTRNDYQAVTGRLAKTSHKVNNSNWQTLASYTYDDLGRMKREVLGSGGEYRDYEYNIRGQLAAINKDYVSNGYTGGQSRTFGEVLSYDYGFTKPRYDGKISGMTWRGSGQRKHAYGYAYDLTGRLTKAYYRNMLLCMVPGGGIITDFNGWNNTNRDYSVGGVSYDENGNITALNQRGNGMVGSAMQPVDMDQLTYTYADNSNRLIAVVDAADDYNLGDFTDGNPGGEDYSYDVAGNLVEDKNKGLGAVAYTWFNKPHTITFSNGNTILYSYDAAGGKRQEIVEIPNQDNKVTDYVGNFVYENNELQYITTPVGRTTFDAETGAAKEEFFVKDHLGNVRSITDLWIWPLKQYLATYELASANLEGMLFDNLDGVRDVKPGGTPQDVNAARLNAADSGRTMGTSLLLSVMAGDEVEMEAFNYYENYDSSSDSPIDDASMLYNIVTTLTAGVGGVGGGEGGTGGNAGITGNLFTAENYEQFLQRTAGGYDAAKPKASLNYLLFDKDMQVVANACGSWQVNGDGDWGLIGTNGQPVTIAESGYIAIYINNASLSDVYFDKLLIKFKKGGLKEENHYYPYGLPMAGMGSAAPGMVANRQKYQGNEYIKDAGLNWMSFGYRDYDPQIGRFNNVDPLATSGGQDMLSPYAAMGNMPQVMVDPWGLSFGSESFGIPTGRNIFSALGPENEKNYAPVAPQSLLTQWQHIIGGGAGSGCITQVTGVRKMLLVIFFATQGSDVTYHLNGIESTPIINESGTFNSGSLNAGAGPGGGSQNSYTINNGTLNQGDEWVVTFTKGEESTFDISDIWDEAWNSSIARGIVPDFLSVGVGFSGVFGVGTGESLEFQWVLRGPEASWKPALTTTVAAGGGYSLAGTFNIGGASYTGKVSDITRSMLEQNSGQGSWPTLWGAGSFAAGLKGGVTVTVAPQSTGGLIIGSQLNLGAGLPAGPLPANLSGGVSNTYILKDWGN